MYGGRGGGAREGTLVEGVGGLLGAEKGGGWGELSEGLWREGVLLEESAGMLEEATGNHGIIFV